MPYYDNNQRYCGVVLTYMYSHGSLQLYGVLSTSIAYLKEGRKHSPASTLASYWNLQGQVPMCELMVEGSNEKRPLFVQPCFPIPVICFA